MSIFEPICLRLIVPCFAIEPFGKQNLGEKSSK